MGSNADFGSVSILVGFEVLPELVASQGQFGRVLPLDVRNAADIFIALKERPDLRVLEIEDLPHLRHRT